MRVVTIVGVIALHVAIASAQPNMAFVHQQPDLAAGFGSLAIAAADLDGDGHIDLAVANSGSDDVSIFWGNGDGTFVAASATLPVQAPSENPIFETPVAIAIADITGDTRPDIITANEAGNTISVLPNRGQRTFGAAIESPAGVSPEAVVVDSFNGDQNLDVATSNFFDATVTVLLGKGDGTFAPLSVCSNQPALACRANSDCQGGTCNPQPIPVGLSPAALAATDLNTDDKIDLIVANSEGGPNFTGSLMVLQGTGTGTFIPQPEINGTTFDHPVALTTALLNTDDKPDVVAVNDLGDSLSLLIGNGDLTFQNDVDLDLSPGSIPEGVVVADLNGDTIPDIAATASFQDKVSIFPGLGNATFGAPQDVALATGATPIGLAVGSFNVGGRIDLATANDMENGTVSVLLNASAVPLCVGDCAGDGTVTVDGIVTLVNIALGTAQLSACPAGLPSGAEVDIALIIQAVNNALNGCVG